MGILQTSCTHDVNEEARREERVWEGDRLDLGVEGRLVGLLVALGRGESMLVVEVCRVGHAVLVDKVNNVLHLLETEAEVLYAITQSAGVELDAFLASLDERVVRRPQSAGMRERCEGIALACQFFYGKGNSHGTGRGPLPSARRHRSSGSSHQ